MKDNIKAFWWEDDTTFCIETADGRIYRLADAYIKSFKFSEDEAEKDNNFIVEELKIEHER